VSQTVSTMNHLETVPSRKASDIVIAYTILRLSFGANILLHGEGCFHTGPEQGMIICNGNFNRLAGLWSFHTIFRI